MIGKVNRGSDTAGLIRYLFGPGRSNEHTDARVIAAYDESLVGVTSPLAELARMLDRPVKAMFNPFDKHVWHCSLRTAPEDRLLTDVEWAQVCRTVLARTGLDNRVVGEGCRYLAVKHADDHVHLVVTLARENGTKPSVGNDFYKVGVAAREVEVRFGLRVTAPVDRTAVAQVKRAESEKALRVGEREPARTILRREVRAAAAGASDGEAFVGGLREAGVLVKVRYSEWNPTVVTGFAVGWPSHLTAEGTPVFYSGGKLGPDLTWPQLAARWTDTTEAAYGQPVGQLVDEIANRFAGLSAGESADVILASGDVLNAVARRAEGVRGIGSYHDAATQFQRATCDPNERRPEPSRSGGELRMIARMVATGPRTPATDLVVALLRLLDVIGQHRAHQGRFVQAGAVIGARQHLIPSRVVDLANLAVSHHGVRVIRPGLRP